MRSGSGIEMKVNGKLLDILKLYSVAVMVLFGCDKSSTEPGIEDHQWISDVPFFINYPDSPEEIEHDNRILESDNFLIFSDASSDEIKILYTQMAEQGFEEIKNAFEISSSEELGIYRDDKTTKLTIFSDRYLNHANLAFPNGFLLIALDSPQVSSWFGGDQDQLHDWYFRTVKHETMHLLQWLLGLDWEPMWTWSERVGRTWPEFWFSEGISEYISGGSFAPIESMTEVNAWLQDPDHINPIRVRLSEDAPVPDSDIGEYYPMFGLAVRYLLEEEGLGMSFVDMKNMYLDMRETVNFRESFEKCMGVSVEYYEENFFILISAFFDQ